MNMNLIEIALEIALEAHRGQTDKAGESYILHPLRLMHKMTSEDEKVTALLHDVIEDFSYTPSKLRDKGIPEQIIEAVLCLTKQSGETYENFILRAKENELAKAVKKADLEDNINILRLNQVSQEDLNRLKKYHNAWHELKNISQGH